VETKFDHPYFATINSDLNLSKEEYKEEAWSKDQYRLPPIKSPRSNFQLLQSPVWKSNQENAGFLDNLEWSLPMSSRYKQMKIN